MEPVRTRGSNFVYRGPSPDVGDAWVERRPTERAVYLTWLLTDEERAAIADGATLRLGIIGMEPIPVVSLSVSGDEPLSGRGCHLRDQALRAIADATGEDRRSAPGWWEISQDLLDEFMEARALDPDDGGVPTLWGRPLLVIEATSGHLAFEAGTYTGPPS